MDLKPEVGADKIAIPITFDVKSQTLNLKMSKLYIALAVIVASIIAWIVVMFIASSDNIRIIASVVLLGIAPIIARFAIVEEYKFRKNFERLSEKNFTYDYGLFWGIYDTAQVGDSATAFLHTSGMTSFFVAFDKDVVVGKHNDSDYAHFEAISNAYALVAKKGISCVHIDYMDNVGKDPRMNTLFASAEKCESEDLKNIVLDMLDFMQWDMQGAFSTYDVYCFSANMRVDLLWDELQPVISAFLAGNYIRARTLDRNGVRDLVESVYTVPDFSVTRTCDSLFSGRGSTNHIKIIWTEVDGKREIVNKTRKQLADEARIRNAEMEARKATKHKRGKGTSAEALDLFNDSSASSSQISGGTDAFGQPISNGGLPRARATKLEPAKTEPVKTQSSSESDEFNLFDS